MGWPCHPGHVLQCPESYAGQWSGQWCEFGMGVGVHQGSVLSPLLFILVLEALSREFRTGVLWSPSFSTPMSWCSSRTPRRSVSPSSRRGRLAWKLMGSVSTWRRPIKFLVFGVGLEVLKNSGNYHCAICCSGVANSPIECSQRKLWVHKGCRGFTDRLRLTQTMSTQDVTAMLGPSTADQRLEGMSMTPCLM